MRGITYVFQIWLGILLHLLNMQTILDLVGQLYNQNEAIRLNAEAELNNHHRLATSLYSGFDTALKL
jgi:hypothetical protein